VVKKEMVQLYIHHKSHKGAQKKAFVAFCAFCGEKRNGAVVYSPQKSQRSTKENLCGLLCLMW
jgi:hypothetical protein